MNYSQELNAANVVYVVSFQGGFRTFLTKAEAVEIAGEYRAKGRRAHITKQHR